MKIENYVITQVFQKNEIENGISLVFLNKNNPREALVLKMFSFYLINISDRINIDGFSEINIDNREGSAVSDTYIKGIKTTDVNDLNYIKFNNESLLVLTSTLDNISGESYQNLRLFRNKKSVQIGPLGITEYEKFCQDFEHEQDCNVLDLRFNGSVSN
jgi:hypothetical protein